uniref:NADH dehydrogenase subunit 2 n=1 Tax=Piagetiella africana TaxID=2965260 RepID=UPI00286AA872|nr:NADH dehydrogenase subunit 2 [Piagetiella africana]WKF19578.1 NADH dehydrogenase subunit 2 [Piagetiella africana]
MSQSPRTLLPVEVTMLCTICNLLITSSFSLWSMWLGLESMNFFTIPWLMEGEDLQKMLKCFMYFIVQCASSSMFLMGTLDIMNIYFFVLATTSMMLKMGVFPFHIWMIHVVEMMKWKKFSIFMTILKMPPLTVMLYLNPELWVMKVSWGGLLSPTQGLKNLSIRMMLTYSSVSYYSWLMIVVVLSKNLTFFFLMAYWTVLIMSCVMFSYKICNSVKDLISKKFHILDGYIMMSVMGFPPFLGFYPKLFTMKNMVFNNMVMESLMLSFMSLMPMYMYLKMLFSQCLKFYNSNYSFIFSGNKYFYIMLTITASMLAEMIYFVT